MDNNEIKALAREILAAHHCTEETYEGTPKNVIRADLDEAYPDGYKGIDNESLTEAIFAISTTDRGWAKPFKVEIDGDGSRWGFTDLRDDVYEALKDALETGKPFETDWISSAKDLGAWRMERHLTNGKIVVEGCASMDEDEALVYDATPDGVELDDEAIESILDIYADLGGFFETSDTADLPADSSIGDVLCAVDELFDGLNRNLTDAFGIMKSIVADYIDEAEEG